MLFSIFSLDVPLLSAHAQIQNRKMKNMIEIEIGKNLMIVIVFVAICAVAIGGEWMIATIFRGDNR
jgi:hypothetical protein